MTRKGTKKLHQDQRRKSILRAAAKVFSEKGFVDTKLEDIFETADISRTLFYVHFKSKKELYLAILEDGLVSMPSELTTENDARLRLAEAISAAQAEPDYFRLLFRHAAKEPEFREIVWQRDSLREQMIEQALDPAITNPMDRKLVAHLVRETVFNTILAWTDFGCPDSERILPLLGQLIRKIILSYTPKVE